MYFSLHVQLAGFSTLHLYFSLFFYRVSSGLLFIVIGFVPDITTWKSHAQIIEGDTPPEDQGNKQEAEKDCLLEGLRY